MKILPDYIIEYMPELEEAIEEVRLSIMDHAYEMLKCLDIDELTSDEIRHKLELYDIKVEDMTDSWLPNGRFYRMYSSIKHNRTRQNAIYAIAKSGGQFEGVWSTEFSKKSEYSFRSIQILRHYEIASNLDGYFYISGNTARHLDNSVASSAVAALQSDILIAQALPAGYTYLYIPWPRPVYPNDSTYFYNVNMLLFDRLTFVEDCELDGYNSHNKSYHDKYPASMYYNWKTGSNTPWRTPYWFDYHYINNMTHIESISWPISESGKYYVYNLADDSKEEVLIDSLANGVYPEIYEPNQKELYSANSTFPTKCYTFGSYRTSEPNRSQRFTFNSHSYSTDSIDENEFIDYTDNISIKPGPYRWDILSKDVLLENDHTYHINTYKPAWNESTPFFDASQSFSYESKNSLLNWFELKQYENRPQLSNNDYSNVKEYESIIKDNKPPISKETFTSYERPTIGKLDPIYIGYTLPCTGLNEDSQIVGILLESYGVNDLYEFVEDENHNYDVTKQYCLVGKKVESDDIPDDKVNYSSIEIDPLLKKLYINLNGSLPASSLYQYFTYKKLNIHTLYFKSNYSNKVLYEFNNFVYHVNKSFDDGDSYTSSHGVALADIITYDSPSTDSQSNGSLPAGGEFNVSKRSSGWLKISNSPEKWIYSKDTTLGVDEIYYYSGDKSLQYNIIGLYKSDGTKVNYKHCALNLYKSEDSDNVKYDLRLDAYDIDYNKSILELQDNWYQLNSFGGKESYIHSLLNDTNDEYVIIRSSADDVNSSYSYINLYCKRKFTLSIKVLHAGLRASSSTVISLDNNIINSVNNGPENVDTDVSEWASWNIISSSIPVGTHQLKFIYNSNGENRSDLDCTYIAIKKNDLGDLKFYKRIEAAFVKFTVEECAGSTKDITQRKLPVEISPDNKIYYEDGTSYNGKYIESQQLIYANENDWWLPRDEYILRGYMFNSTQESYTLSNISVGGNHSESESVNLGIIDL